MFRLVLWITCFAVYYTQAGPAIPRQKKILGPDIFQGQMSVQDDFLKIESEVLQTSMKISDMVQWVIKESFRVADEMKLFLNIRVDYVLETKNNSLAGGNDKIKRCIKEMSIDEDILYTKSQLKNYIHHCTQNLFGQAVQIEKRMTSLINSARAHFIQAMDSMWLCEIEASHNAKPWQKLADHNCINSLKEEGKEINHSLPERVDKHLQEAQRLYISSESELQKCIIHCKSTVSESATFILQELKRCTVNNSY